jgi:hypothetical protein
MILSINLWWYYYLAKNPEKFIKFNKNNPFIEFTKNSREFRCVECVIPLKNEGGATVHSTRTHKMNLDGTPSKSKPKKNNSTLKTVDSTSEYTIEDDSDSDIVMRMNATDDAKSATKIIKDIPLMYLYYMLKEKRILHPNWSLHDFLREAAYMYADRYGVIQNFYQDETLLDRGTQRSMELVRQRWDEHDVDQLLDST